MNTEPVHTGPELISCHECGLLQRVVPLPDGGKAKCPRCGMTLRKERRNSIEDTLGLTLAAVILYVLANTLPFITFKLQGREQHSILISGVFEFMEQQLWALAAVVFLVAILFPLLKLLGNLLVLVPLRLGYTPRYIAPLFRLLETLHPWAMMEVYMLGVLVAYVKLTSMATLDLGPALYCFAALIVVMAAADAALQPHVVWNRLGIPPQPMKKPRGKPLPIGCHSCGLVTDVRALPSSAHASCPRCGAHLHYRKTNSLNRTWALLLTAAILYIPANVYPVMTVISFGAGEPDTILSGVKKLIDVGMWPLALLVFFASVTVPVLKMIGLGYLLISVQRKSRWRLRDRTVLLSGDRGGWAVVDDRHFHDCHIDRAGETGLDRYNRAGCRCDVVCRGGHRDDDRFDVF